MGFFDSKSKQETTMEYENKQLAGYTAAYRGAAPWGFATLDPTATLAAMGQGTKVAGKNLGADFKATLEGMSKEEKQQSKASNEALERIVERQKSGNFLTPQETEFVNTSLDKAFESSRNIAYKDWEKGAQSLAGRQGLRTSDTPVARPAMESLRDMELGFSSQRAQAGLDTTLKLSANQNLFDEQLMNSLNTLQFNKWSTRQSHLFGGGLSAAANLGYKTNQTSYTTQGMSGFGQVMAGFQMANAAGEFGKNMGGMGMAAGMISDRRLKSNIVRIAEHPLGIGIYSYTIFGQHQIGVMADEVRTVRPEAVERGADGYDRVLYSMLG